MISGTESKRFIDILLGLEESGADFTEDDVRDEAITMLIAVSYRNDRVNVTVE